MANDERDLIFLESVFKNTIWGGRKMEEEYGYEIPDGPVGECWAISAHPHGDCVVSKGTFAGKHLSELWDTRRDLFGNAEGDRFPLLIKVIDAADDLSVQVHPDDAYANEHENGSLGKHECWYVLACHEHGHIAVGQKARSREEMAQMAADKRWDDIVNEISIEPGDFFNIKPGTVHAILAGTLILETQQSSDVTYRVYDFERRQADGTLRETHLAQALDVIDFDTPAPTSGKVTAPEIDGVTHLLTCKYFEVDHVCVADEKVFAQPYPFLCVSIIKGAGSVTCGGEVHELKKGDHFLAPSDCGDLTFTGEMEFICSHI